MKVASTDGRAICPTDVAVEPRAEVPLGVLARTRVRLLSPLLAGWRARFLLAFALGVAFVSILLASGTAVTIQWMETPQFCGQCHTMKPEFTAYARSPHRTVKCAECHVPKGVEGLVEAKVQGAFQAAALLANTYERPIPPAAHKMAKGAESCQECHREAPSGEDRLVVRRHYEPDEQNTERKVALVVKLSDVAGNRLRGIHWHASSQVEYVPRGPDEHRIDYIRVTDPSGQVKEYVSKDLLTASESTRGLFGEVRDSGQLKRMDCLTCHNRVGHEFLSPDQAIDGAIAAGKIDRALPYVRKKGDELLSAGYSSTEEAETAIGALSDFYRANYPAVYEQRRTAIDDAVQALRGLYGQVASPEMLATYEDYPSFLGHKETSGCFRCHDGAHIMVERDRPTSTIVPFNCSLCHTFPEMGSDIRGVPLGVPPPDHGAKQWMSDHKAPAGSTDITRTECSNCHSQSYCTNCHTTGISHTDMLYNHARVIREKGSGACASCHQSAQAGVGSPFCERCHDGEQGARAQRH